MGFQIVPAAQLHAPDKQSTKQQPHAPNKQQGSGSPASGPAILPYESAAQPIHLYPSQMIGGAPPPPTALQRVTLINYVKGTGQQP